MPWTVTPFFASWELVGRFPAILEDDVVGKAATDLYNDAQRMLDRILQEGLLEARGVVGFWPANADGDDVIVYADEDRTTELARLHTLRQQMLKTGDGANVAMADFVAPVGTKPDYIGGFAVTAGHGELAQAKAFKDAGDDYSAILFTALADRLAEAFDIDTLVAEQYRGIRPAPGYPMQPDHTEKATLFQLLNATDAAGIELTESFAMNPPAAVSGVYFAHPEAHYFGVGRIEKDQVADYAKRKGWDLRTAERWLAPILNYEPA